MADPERRMPWLNPGDRSVLAILCVALIAVVGLQVAQRWGWGESPPRLSRSGQLQGHRIDINGAAWWELQALQGIGPKRARDVVAYRQKHGPFRSLDELTGVDGIGEKTLKELRPHLTIGLPEDVDEARR